MDKRQREGLTLVELLVVTAMLGVLLALLLPAVQKVRQASKREACAERLMQIGLALHNYHDTYGSLPPGLDSYAVSPDLTENVYWYWSWMARILPFIDQEDLWQQADAFARYGDGQYNPWRAGFDPTTGQQVPSNPVLAVPLDAWHCPADNRDLIADYQGLTVAFTDYLGVSGLHLYGPGMQNRNEGVLFDTSRVRFVDITDGLSDTVVVGERPPTVDLNYGWWFAGAGQKGAGSGSTDVVLGAEELNIEHHSPCPQGPYQFGPGRIENQCDNFHYWSLHSGGANFLFADASVHFLAYTIDPALLPALATRAGGEVVDVPPGPADR